MPILFVGGTGIISSACSPRVLAAGHDLTMEDRGATATRPITGSVEVLHADARDPAAVRATIVSREFDVVVDFVAYTPDHAQSDIDLFAG